jgi:hypothetical protein
VLQGEADGLGGTRANRSGRGSRSARRTGCGPRSGAVSNGTVAGTSRTCGSSDMRKSPIMMPRPHDLEMHEDPTSRSAAGMKARQGRHLAMTRGVGAPGVARSRCSQSVARTRAGPRSDTPRCKGPRAEG